MQLKARNLSMHESKLTYVCALNLSSSTPFYMKTDDQLKLFVLGRTRKHMFHGCFTISNEISRYHAKNSFWHLKT